MGSEREEIQRRRQALCARLRAFSHEPLMRGSLVERRRQCGRPNCACAADPAAWHGGKFLTVQIHGKSEALHIRPEDETYVRDAVAAYARLWDLINDFTRCEFAELRRQVRERHRDRRRKT